MIGGKLEQGDIKLEVESSKWYNTAPLITPDAESEGVIGGSLSNGSNWVVTAGDWITARPPWNADAPDAFGNRRWWLNTAMAKKVFGFEGTGGIEGTPGKYYSMDVDLRTYVTSMNGNVDYVAQPPCRLNLYATNGNESQDVLIAQSTVTNPILPSNNGWPFHPGYREWRLSLNSVAPMPVGKTYFRFEVEYDNSFTAVKDVYLPANYSYPTVPSNLNFFSFRWGSLHVYEHTGAAQEWNPVYPAQPFSYVWETQRVYYNNATKGINCTYTLRKDSLIPDKGMKISAYLGWAESAFNIQLTTPVGTWTTANQSLAVGRHEWTFPAAYFNSDDEQTITLKFNARGIEKPLIVANQPFDDADGHNFYTYDDWTGWVSSIDIERYDTEVSTSTIALREKEGVYLPGYGDSRFDVGPYFEQGKRIRITAPNAYPGQTWGAYQGYTLDTYNTLFVGEIHNRIELEKK